jgi:hypothetical protein
MWTGPQVLREPFLSHVDDCQGALDVGLLDMAASTGKLKVEKVLDMQEMY